MLIQPIESKNDSIYWSLQQVGFRRIWRTPGKYVFAKAAGEGRFTESIKLHFDQLRIVLLRGLTGDDQPMGLPARKDWISISPTALSTPSTNLNRATQKEQDPAGPCSRNLIYLVCYPLNRTGLAPLIPDFY